MVSVVITLRSQCVFLGWGPVMSKLSLSLSAELLTRLTAIAEQKEISLEDSALEALAEYIENWEDFNRTLEHLESGEEERTVLKAVGE